MFCTAGHDDDDDDGDGDDDDDDDDDAYDLYSWPAEVGRFGCQRGSASSPSGKAG